MHQDPVIVAHDDEEPADEMEVEDIKAAELVVLDSEPEQSLKEVEELVQVLDSEDDEQEEVEEPEASESHPPRVWPELGTVRRQRYQAEVEKIRETFEDEVDPEDTTMVSEYAEEIFEYMQELEVRRFPEWLRFDR